MAALDTQADLIVMATHGRTGLQRAAGQVLRTACTPVVLVHPNVAPNVAPSSPPDAEIEHPLAEEFGPIPTF